MNIFHYLIDNLKKLKDFEQKCGEEYIKSQINNNPIQENNISINYR